MRGLRNLLFVLSFGLAAVTFSAASATDVYITPDGSSQGACTGLAHPPSWFNTSSNWGSGAGQIGPGTTVHLCGTFTGSAGQQFLVAQGNGASGSPITILFENGTILQAPYFSTSGAISVSGKSYIVIDGGSNGVIQNTDNGTNLSYHQKSVAIQASPCSNCEFRNLNIRNLYVHVMCEGSGCDQSVDQSQNNAVQFQGSNILIHDNIMHDIGWALYQNYTNDSNIQIYNNEIYNMDHGVACAGANYVVASEYIYNNHFHDMATWDTGNADAYHHDGIHCYNGSGGQISKLYIYNNLFDGNEGNCCVTAWIFLESPGSGTPWTKTGSAFVWNNIFIGSLDLGNGQLSIDAGTGHQVYNNTFLIASPGGGACLNSFQGQPGSSMTVKNNAFSGCNQMVRFDSNVASATFDNNAYANSNGNANPIFSWAGHSSTDSLATWQSQTGQDVHSNANFSGTLGTNGAGVPQSGSMLVGVGANLSNLASGNMASLGSDTGAGDSHVPVARPQSGSWTAGAYLYGSGGNSPQAPSGLAAVVQ